MHPNVKVPTMVKFPEQDMFLWRGQAIDAPKYMDAECRVEITQGGHWGMLDYPDDVNKLMLEWFDLPASTAGTISTIPMKGKRTALWGRGVAATL